MHHYCAHIQKDGARYSKITILGLGLTITDKETLAELEAPDSDIQEFVEHHTQEYITKLLAQGKDVPNPQKAQQPETIQVTKGDSLMLVRVKIKQQKGCLARLFPGFGACTSIVSAVSGTVISIASLDLATGNLGLSVLQALNSNMVIGLTLYFCSPSGKSLEEIGRSLDNYIARQQSNEHSSQASQSTGAVVPNDRLTQIKMCLVKHAPNKMNLINGSLAVAVVANSVSFVVGMVQQLSAVQEEADEKDIMPDWFFNMNKWAFVLSTGVSGFIFVSSFFMQLSARIEHFLTEREAKKLATTDSAAVTEHKVQLAEMEPPDGEQVMASPVPG